MNKTTKFSVLVLSVLLMSACSNTPVAQHKKELKKLDRLKKEANNEPATYQIDYFSEKQQIIKNRTVQAENARSKGDFELALLQYQLILEIDPYNKVALDEINKIKKLEQAKLLYSLAKTTYEKGDFETALIILKEVMQLAPELEKAFNLKFDIERELNHRNLSQPLANERLRQHVSLEFRNAQIQAVLEILSQHSGINFILDKDARLEQTTTIYAKDTTVQEALDMIVRTSGLNYKMLNTKTFLIYQDIPDKKKIYEDLITRSFYLGNADAEKAQEMIHKLYEPKAIFYDSKLRMLVIRDTQPVINSIEKLLEAYDLPMSEVILDIEVLEVSRDTLLGLGVEFPDKVQVRAFNPLGIAGEYTVSQLRNMTSNNLSLVATDPLTTVNFKQTSGKTKLLANPRIRVKSREEASFLIGDKVPVITTTTGQASGFIAESVNYLDVGLKVEVKPEVNKNKQVQIAVKLEVSNIAKEITTRNGLVYQIGTRNASTILQLHDGETQMLAGLIRDDTKTSATHLPGIGKMPLLGRLFSNTTNSKNKSEIVLLITPRIVRPYTLPAPHFQEFASGTGSQVTTTPLRLTEHSSYLAKAQPMQNEFNSIQTNTTVKNSESIEISNAIGSERNDNPHKINVSGELSANFQLSGLSVITRGQEFTLALIQNTPAFQSLNFDLIHNTSWELVKVLNIAQTTQVSQEKIPKGTRLSFGVTPAHQGPVALLTFKVSNEELNKTASLIIENGQIKLKDGQIPQILSDYLIKKFEIK